MAVGRLWKNGAKKIGADGFELTNSDIWFTPVDSTFRLTSSTYRSTALRLLRRADIEGSLGVGRVSLLLSCRCLVAKLYPQVTERTLRVINS
jgi:hypothetical protein